MSESNPLIFFVLNNLKIDENGIIYYSRYREEESKDEIFKIKDNRTLNMLVYAIEYFDKYQPQSGFISKIEIPALKMILENCVFKGRISKVQSRNLSRILKHISKRRSVF